MARCGRCGLYCGYPEETAERTATGVCLWFQMKIPEDAVWEKRKCAEFFERIPGWTPLEQWRYRQSRDSIGGSYKSVQRALFFSAAALLISVYRLLF